MNVREFASLPDIDGVAARMMNLVDEPGTRRLFVNDMRGPLYSVSYDGATVSALPRHQRSEVGRRRAVGRPRARLPELCVPSAVRPGRHARVRQVLHLHRHDQPDAGAGLHDRAARRPRTTRCCSSGRRRRQAPRPTTADRRASCSGCGSRSPTTTRARSRSTRCAQPGSAEFGLLYIGVADGGSGGDPMRLAQNLGVGVRQDLPHRSARHEQPQQEVRHPAGQPVREDGRARCRRSTRYGVRNPQRFAWDSRNGNMFLADIGQNIVEEISPVTAGANLGWNVWEGSYRFISRQAVSLEKPRSDPKVTYPVAEWGQVDPLLQSSSAASGLVVYRGSRDPAAGEPPDLHRHAERRDLLRQRRQAAGRAARMPSGAILIAYATATRRRCSR